MAEIEDIKYKINFRDIKSLYILKTVFSYLNKKQLLNMIIYNKELQKIYSIDIDYYKEISGKYKIGGKNGKGREYKRLLYNLIFEGEYLNGKRNGKGKEYYDNDKLKFEGEYLNGKEWNGKEYEYYKNGKVKCEREYLNGKRNGKEIKYEYYKNGNLKFEGEYLNGKEWNGKEYEYYDNGKLKYEREYLKWKRMERKRIL